MGDTAFWQGRARVASSKRTRLVRSALLVAALALAGALLDPWILEPAGPIATRPERVTGTFTRCGRGSSPACVVDGDTLRLGDRRVRLLSIDAPELTDARCPGERALGERAADRLVELVNDGEFDLVGHRFYATDSYGRDLRLARRGEISFGQILIDEGLAHRYFGAKRAWC